MGISIQNMKETKYVPEEIQISSLFLNCRIIILFDISEMEVNKMDEAGLDGKRI